MYSAGALAAKCDVPRGASIEMDVERLLWWQAVFGCLPHLGRPSAFLVFRCFDRLHCRGHRLVAFAIWLSRSVPARGRLLSLLIFSFLPSLIEFFSTFELFS